MSQVPNFPGVNAPVIHETVECEGQAGRVVVNAKDFLSDWQPRGYKLVPATRTGTKETIDLSGGTNVEDPTAVKTEPAPAPEAVATPAAPAPAPVAPATAAPARSNGKGK